MFLWMFFFTPGLAVDFLVAGVAGMICRWRFVVREGPDQVWCGHIFRVRGHREKPGPGGCGEGVKDIGEQI